MHLPADVIQPLLPLSLISCTLPPYSCSSSPTNLLFIIQPAQILVHVQAGVLVLSTAPDSLPHALTQLIHSHLLGLGSDIHSQRGLS